MSTQVNTITGDNLQALVAPQKSERVSSPANTEAAPDIRQALRISGMLQTTLEVDRLIEVFSEQVKPSVHHTGITYKNAEADVSVRFGRSGPHTCNYQLVVNDEQLGELTLARAKPFTSEEAQALEYMLCTLIYPLRNALLYQQALNAAHKDALTGVNNRSTFNETLRREVELARRYKRPLSLIVLDIDFFKRINDTLGHAAGDFVIKALAERTGACIRSSDMLFRYGGEEFVVVLSNTGQRGAAKLAERIRKAVEKTQCRYDDDLIEITVSLGVASLGEDENERSLFERADQALYLAKANGRNRVELGEEVEEPAPEPC